MAIRGPALGAGGGRQMGVEDEDFEWLAVSCGWAWIGWSQDITVYYWFVCGMGLTGANGTLSLRRLSAVLEMHQRA